MIRRISSNEQGIAMLIALALITLLTVIALSLFVVTGGDSTRSKRDQSATGSYHAAEAGTNAYLSDLTESTVFFNSYMAKGEATRSDSNNVAHPSSPTSDLPWTWGSSWTYNTSAAADTGWFDLGNGYQYLLQVYPPNPNVQQGPGQVTTRIDVTGRPKESTDPSTWRTIETMIRPSALTDFQTFSGTSITYAATATTTGPIFVGEDKNGNRGTLTHNGTAKANLYAEGYVGGSTTLANGARKYDSTTNPTAICKLNNCNKILFSSFQSTLTTVQGAAGAGGITLAATDPSNSGLSGQSYHVDAWKLAFQSDGTLQISSCKLYSHTTGSGRHQVTTTYADYDGSTPPVCGTATIQNVPSNGAIYSAADVLISGVVKGRVTVATAGDVVFGGNTAYNTNGQDVLGLEAQGTVYVAEWSHTPGSTLTLWAALLGLNGPFEADPNFNNPSGTMNYYGSAAVYGQSSGAIVFTNMFSTRNYNYDANLLSVQPPYWPSLGNAFVIVVQREL